MIHFKCLQHEKELILIDSNYLKLNVQNKWYVYLNEFNPIRNDFWNHWLEKNYTSKLAKNKQFLFQWNKKKTSCYEKWERKCSS